MGLAQTCLYNEFALKILLIFKKYFTCQLQNKEYLIALFRHWPLSCKQFFSEHFAENRMTDEQVQNCGAQTLCNFLEHSVIQYIFSINIYIVNNK